MDLGLDVVRFEFHMIEFIPNLCNNQYKTKVVTTPMHYQEPRMLKICLWNHLVNFINCTNNKVQ